MTTTTELAATVSVTYACGHTVDTVLHTDTVARFALAGATMAAARQKVADQLAVRIDEESRCLCAACRRAEYEAQVAASRAYNVAQQAREDAMSPQELAAWRHELYLSADVAHAASPEELAAERAAALRANAALNRAMRAGDPSGL